MCGQKARDQIQIFGSMSRFLDFFGVDSHEKGRKQGILVKAKLAYILHYD
jgi:hypothetical protein